MRNPIFGSKSVFANPSAGQGQPVGASYPGHQPNAGAYGQAPYGQAPYGQPQYGQNAYGQAPYGQAPYGQAGLDTGYAHPYGEPVQPRYDAPPQGSLVQGRMTYDDVITRTGMLLGIIAALTAAIFFMKSPAITMASLVVGLVGGLVLGLVCAFKKKPVPALIVAYAVFEGLFIGGISTVFASQSPQGGYIIVQASLATFAVFGSVLVLFRSGKVRTSPKLTKIFYVAMSAYLVFSLLNMILVMTGVLNGWGMRSGGIGIVVGLLAVLMGAYSFVMDFEDIRDGVEAGVPELYSWQAAFGLTVTMVWMYLEILRLIRLFSGND